MNIFPISTVQEIRKLVQKQGFAMTMELINMDSLKIYQHLAEYRYSARGILGWLLLDVTWRGDFLIG